MAHSKVVKRPDGSPYCELYVGDEYFKIMFLKNTGIDGYVVTMDRKVIPDLKKFLESLEPSEKFLNPYIEKKS